MDLSPDEDNFQGRLLHQAALWDNVELLQELLASGADVNARDANQRSALHAAALAERSRCLAALCAAGAEVDAKSDAPTGGKTALHIAAERGHVENVKTLLTSGADLSVTDAAGMTALALAERQRHRHAVLALREARDALERERLSQHAQIRELVLRGETHQLRQKLASLGDAAGLIVNLTPGGANTLLYVASEAGLTSAVAALLEAGADGRAHSVTKYSPLYIAACHGHRDIATMLLHHFPHAAQQETVEKWLPVHAACIGGHAAMATALLQFPYPESVLTTYTDATGQWEYRAAFDVNAADVSGQSALHVACTLGNLPVVEALLAHTVVAQPTAQHTPTSPPAPAVTPPARAGISLGIHAIVNKLTGSNRNEPTETEHRIRPVRVDASRHGDSCVACATRGGHMRVVAKLLAAGAKADAPALPPSLDQMSDSSLRRRSRSASASGRRHSPSPGPRDTREGPWTALALAAHYKHVAIAEMLLRHGAVDPECRALREAASNGLTDLMPLILATKAYPDPDHKLNKTSVSERVFSSRDNDTALTYSSVCPSTAVMVNWRELRCQLAQLRMSWLRTAAIRMNTKLSSGGAALHALTRIDVSNNELRLLPPELFTLLSLRYLNAAQNKLERLPSLSDPFEDELDSKGRKIKKNSKKNRPEVYSAPVLQELYLQDNRLEELPPELFSLPALQTLDVSNNKLRSVPPAVWAAPCLRDLSAKLNHLKDLPIPTHGDESSSPSRVTSPSGSSPHIVRSPSSGSGQFNFTQYKSTSRSPSIECSESDVPDDADGIPTLGNRAGNAVWCEPRRVHTWRGVVAPPSPCPAGASPLQALNLAHNQFTAIPPVLACVAPALTRLSMAYNSLRSMSFVTSYPTGLRQLDLSHNEITCWPSLPQIENFGTSEGDPLACYCPGSEGSRARPRSGSSVRSALLSVACPARRHLRLETLRTLILANNLLTRIQLTTDDDGFTSQPHDGSVTDDDDEWNCGSSLKSRLLFPMLSMLDVSCNMLRAVPPAIHELTSLAVLNISGNKDITDLPPQMGLLSRLWNLNTLGCSLNEPLKSMVESGRYKSMDIIGYLLSVHREAKPYTRCKLMFVGLQGIGKTSLLECLRQESSIQHRRKPTDHWARRMGNKGTRRNMSTVGVDIGTWTYEKHRTSRGPVTFRTWDFGGQHEYYATHQYFLSRRSIYLVVWKVTDGRKGLAGALDWLRSIQARAPGSPVIMVATHYDQTSNSALPESESPEALQRLIRSTIMAAPDADKLGLPRVLDSVEVSCSTRHNIRLLADIIYSVAFSVKPPGSKEALLEQRIPATYLALEECVTALAAELTEPVLKHQQYKTLVTQYMQQKNLRMFRDAAELHQATMFLHENGVLLHYDDATLKELYFLRPQWLCDVLAHVVTVREINPFARNGIMKVEDLAHVFKASPLLAGGEDATSLGVSLLNKFELALCWDHRVLLVPPLLPAHEPAKPQLAVRHRPPRGTPRRAWPPAAPLATFANVSRGTDSPTLVQEAIGGITVSGRSGGFALRRLVLLSYVPCGFWARLVTRVLADPSVADQPAMLYKPPSEVENDDSVCKALELSWGWKVWRSGLSLSCGGVTVAALRELKPNCDPVLGTVDCDTEHPYANLRLRVKQEGTWCSLDVESSACVEMLLPAHVCVLKRDDGAPVAGYQSLSLEPNPETLTKLLALLSDHVDLLLEDWYPSLGTRFVHTSEGRCLITRVVPCPACLRDAHSLQAADPHRSTDHLAQAFKRLELGGMEQKRVRVSQESRASDGDSGVGAESNASSRLGSVEGVVSPVPGSEYVVAHAWTVEECILAACTGAALRCPTHPHDVGLRDLAPDTLLLDVEESKRARWEQLSISGVAGRGAFGTVLAGAWRRGGVPPSRVAVKALQPVPPPHQADAAAHQAYKAAAARWQREPVSAACRAYCALRQELAVLHRLAHPHVLPLRAVCPQPLALLLTLAPQGSLEGRLREYRGCGVRVGVRAARAIALQSAKALEYLHSNRVVYRDLKSENVLVWTMPLPGDAAAAEASAAPIAVHVKLGDYGISRLAPPSGTKGFGGTEGFMAPEMMRYNGEEEYNEKVDCFSFGMLLYEIMTLRQPFEGHEAVKEAVLDGARPSLSPKDLEYPCCLLETMRVCWAAAPSLRPSAGALVSVLGAPELGALQDAAAVGGATTAAAAPLANVHECGMGGWEVWCGGEGDRLHALACTRASVTHHHTARIPPDKGEPVAVTAMCRVGASMWLGDSAGRITVYNISSCSVSWSVAVPELVGEARAPVSALLPIHTGRVALALTSGRLFLVSSLAPQGEGSFILTELGTATSLYCLAAVPTPTGMELWAGGDGLYCYTINAEGVCAAETLPVPLTHPAEGRNSAGEAERSAQEVEEERAQKRVTLLAAPEDEPYVAVYYDPGVCIYQWSVRTRRQTVCLDVSKMAPCSESLQSIAIDERIARENCRVTALCASGGLVYVGTAWGCVVVADGSSLRPLTVFRPYTAHVRAIMPLPPHKTAGSGAMLATLGTGYRPLTQRYAPQQSNPHQYTGDYCLLWRASRWLPD